MPDKNKHNLFSKEELFKLIDEKKSLPPEADDFDKEAMEGLSMLSDRRKVEGLNNSIDEVLRKEAAKAKRKKNLYVLSAAASVILIIGLFFLFKEISFDKKENVLAENTGSSSVNTKPEEAKTSDEKIPEEKKADEQVSVKNNESNSQGDAAPAPPAEVAVDATTKTINDASEKNDKAQGGKDYKSALAKQDQLKWTDAKKSEEKLQDEEKDKTRYASNTVWTTPAASGSGVAMDESKSKSADDYRSKAESDADANNVAANNTSNAAQKNTEVAVNEKEKDFAPAKKSKTKEQTAKPDTIISDMLAGYSYSDQNSTKGLVQGGPPQTASPVQTQTESSAAFGKTTEIPKEQKLAQEESRKKTGKHESQPDSKVVASFQNTEPKSALKDNSNEGAAEFVGGNSALQQYIKKNLKISSPEKSGKMEAEFVVNQDGKIDPGTVKITTKIKNCNPCSDDVKELVKTMPKWKPAMENGKAASKKKKISVDYNVK